MAERWKGLNDMADKPIKVIFGKFTGRKADVKPHMHGTVLRDFWEPTKETKIMFDTGEFHSYCGTLTTVVDFISLYIKPCGLAGNFYPHRLSDLLQFCEWFPEYSILSLMPDGSSINHPKLGARTYFIAKFNRYAERIVCHGIRNKGVRYPVAGYSISLKRPSITNEQFWRDQGMVVESAPDANEKKRDE